tara:strand:- start:34 stop:312 length:279 start_codon:yes stop_codon:yes gene_type:complete
MRKLVHIIKDMTTMKHQEVRRSGKILPPDSNLGGWAGPRHAPAGHGYHTRHLAQINDLGATLQVGPQPLVKKYFDPDPQRTLGDPCKEIFRV